VEGRNWTIRQGVPGPSGQMGFLLQAPPDEALDWDIEHEIASTSRCWMSEHRAWWIAMPYLNTAHGIMARFERCPEPAWVRLARLHLPANLSGWLVSRFELSRSLGGSVDRA
jgi:hypothetical protein